MNSITRTYSNSLTGFLQNPISRALSNNNTQIQLNNKKLSPTVNTHNTNSNSQPSETDKNSNQNNSENNEAQKHSGIQAKNGLVLTQAEMKLLDELKKTDTEVRQHEMAHIAAGGKYITSGANFTYQRGPDGKNYAVGGEVGIDTSAVSEDPEATIQKMHQVRSAALAPANPSSQDLEVAANAIFKESKAISELMIFQKKEQASANEKRVLGNYKKAIDSYQKTNSMTGKEISSFQIAV